MSDQQKHIGQENNDKRDFALDTLLKEKFENERLENWKKLMPIPEETNNTNKTIKLVGVLIIGLLLSALGYFSLNQDDPVQLAENLISTTAIASLDDLHARGEEAGEVNSEAVAFYKAVELLKAEEADIFEAIEILSDLTAKKNKYQIEAIWFKAIALTKIGDNKNARLELDKLASISNYQEKNIKTLLDLLN